MSQELRPLPLKDSALFRQSAYVDGAWIAADSGATLQVEDPATGALLGSIPDMGVDETRRAIEAAQRAQPGWAVLTGKARARLLRDWADLMMAHQEDLATLMTLEQGKPLVESRGEIAYAAGYMEWFGEEAKRIYGDIIPAHGADKRIFVAKQPIGVCAAITPWNFPAAMITRKLAPALAAGCTMVLRPSELTPYSALALAVLAERVGIPAGVFSVVTGQAKPIGGELTSNPIVRKLSFTGSTAVGKLLAAQCAGTVKKLSLELGGNAPFIVFDDADLEAAVAGAMASKYRNAGQTCVCANRMLVQAGIYERFAARLAEEAAKLKVGSGLDPDTRIGPLIDTRAIAKVERHVEDAVSRGGVVLTGGHRGERTYYAPTVIANVPREALTMREEVFGPVAPLIRFETEAEVVHRANDTEFGLAAYFYTRDAARLVRVAERLEYGIVGVNEGLISTEVAPFGGIKESGYGREGSKYGIDDYLAMKYVCLGGVQA